MPDFRITITVENVGGGDIDDLAAAIENDHGFDFGIEDGEFKVQVSQKVGDGYYPRDPGDDVIES